MTIFEFQNIIEESEHYLSMIKFSSEMDLLSLEADQHGLT
jgi:hypothetical protein